MSRDGLNPRERGIVQAIDDGLTYEQIAERLGIGTATLRKHVRALCRRFDCPMRELPERVRAGA